MPQLGLTVYLAFIIHLRDQYFMVLHQYVQLTQFITDRQTHTQQLVD